ncbi:hypothetical protein [Tropicibacter naphthalenivorans]|uniref:Lipoprotein n=1 Tax=Tropicibacter naphthalenivorans TaxID=441103 RepID=A0A0P1G5V7_9RHOB|nr:hypothetical protein [Tropicibacter naphthalenivorans]CUH77108.1 hypothetical protein TRN7648_01299 [Tropicibacter naphthalenivorans]SMC60659.1 hypothetical protein SAMN04488093_102319 [Tropicibacter naphthalenivorans]
MPKFLILLLAALLALPGCEDLPEPLQKVPEYLPKKLPKRTKAVPVDYFRDQVHYQASCTVDAGVIDLPPAIQSMNGPRGNRCINQAIATCNSDYKILHRVYGETPWSILDTQHPFKMKIPKNLRSQKLTINFVCVPSSIGLYEEITPPGVIAEIPAQIVEPTAQPGEDFFTK